MDTPSTGEPAPSLTSVQVLGPDGAPEPPDRNRLRLVPAMALLLLMAFGGGYLLARNPGLSVLPDITDEPTLATTTMVRSTTSAGRSDDPTIFLLESEPSGWYALQPPVLSENVTLVAREEGRWVDDVAVDGGGYVWSLGSGVATRWDPADGTSVTFGEEVFGYAVPREVAAGPDGVVWIAAGPEIFRFDGTWARFRSPDQTEYLIEFQVTPDGELVVVAVREDDDSFRLYRSKPGGDPTTAEALVLPMADVNDMAVGPRGQVWLVGGGGDAGEVFALEGNRLALLPRPNGVQPAGEIAATSSVWITDGEGQSVYGLVDGEWVGVDLPDSNRGPWGGRYPWTIGAGDSVWGAATTSDGSGLQLIRIVEPGSYVSYPPFDGVAGSVSRIDVAGSVVWLGTEAGLCSFDLTTGSWRLWTTPPAGGALPASIDSIAVGPDGTLRAVLGTDPPKIGSLDGAGWQPADELLPPGCEEYGYCSIELVGAADGVVWAVVRTPTGNTLWRNVSEHMWDPVALPDEVRSLGISPRAFGAGSNGTLWLTDPPSTAFFDGTGWAVWSQEDCPGDGQLLVGEDGTPWMLEGGWFPERLWFFSAGQWFLSEAPLPGWAWPVSVAGREGSIWLAVEREVYSFDGTTWTLQFETGGRVSSLAPASGGAMWVAAGDLWLIGKGLPVLVVQDLDARLVPDPDGSVWVLAGGRLYHVERPG